MSENNESNIETQTEIVADGYKIKSSKPKGVPTSMDNNAIGSSGTNKKGGKKVGALKQNSFGAISSGKADVQPKEKKDVVKKEIHKVALFSTKNVSWPGVGAVSKGYNFVTKEQASQWLTRSHIREATPEEVAANLKG